MSSNEIVLDLHKILPKDPQNLSSFDLQELHNVGLEKLREAFIEAHNTLENSHKNLEEFNARVVFIGREEKWINSAPNTAKWAELVDRMRASLDGIFGFKRSNVEVNLYFDCLNARNANLETENELVLFNTITYKIGKSILNEVFEEVVQDIANSLAAVVYQAGMQLRLSIANVALDLGVALSGEKLNSFDTIGKRKAFVGCLEDFYRKTLNRENAYTIRVAESLSANAKPIPPPRGRVQTNRIELRGDNPFKYSEESDIQRLAEIPALNRIAEVTQPIANGKFRRAYAKKKWVCEADQTISVLKDVLNLVDDEQQRKELYMCESSHWSKVSLCLYSGGPLVLDNKMSGRASFTKILPRPLARLSLLLVGTQFGQILIYAISWIGNNHNSKMRIPADVNAPDSTTPLSMDPPILIGCSPKLPQAEQAEIIDIRECVVGGTEFITVDALNTIRVWSFNAMYNSQPPSGLMGYLGLSSTGPQHSKTLFPRGLTDYAPVIPSCTFFLHPAELNLPVLNTSLVGLKGKVSLLNPKQMIQPQAGVVPSCVCFHPMLTMTNRHPSIMVGTHGGDCFKINMDFKTNALDVPIIYLPPFVDMEYVHPLNANSANAVLSSAQKKRRGNKVHRELFHFHKAKIVHMEVLNKLSDCVFTLDADGYIAIWKYNSEFWTANTWFEPKSTAKIELDWQLVKDVSTTGNSIISRFYAQDFDAIERSVEKARSKQIEKNPSKNKRSASPPPEIPTPFQLLLPEEERLSLFLSTGAMSDRQMNWLEDIPVDDIVEPDELRPYDEDEPLIGSWAYLSEQGKAVLSPRQLYDKFAVPDNNTLNSLTLWKTKSPRRGISRYIYTPVRCVPQTVTIRPWNKAPEINSAPKGKDLFKKAVSAVKVANKFATHEADVSHQKAAREVVGSEDCLVIYEKVVVRIDPNRRHKQQNGDASRKNTSRFEEKSRPNSSHSQLSGLNSVNSVNSIQLNGVSPTPLKTSDMFKRAALGVKAGIALGGTPVHAGIAEVSEVSTPVVDNTPKPNDVLRKIAANLRNKDGLSPPNVSEEPVIEQKSSMFSPIVAGKGASMFRNAAKALQEAERKDHGFSPSASTENLLSNTTSVTSLVSLPALHSDEVRYEYFWRRSFVKWKRSFASVITSKMTDDGTELVLILATSVPHKKSAAGSAGSESKASGYDSGSDSGIDDVSGEGNTGRMFNIVSLLVSDLKFLSPIAPFHMEDNETFVSLNVGPIISETLCRYAYVLTSNGLRVFSMGSGFEVKGPSPFRTGISSSGADIQRGMHLPVAAKTLSTLFKDYEYHHFSMCPKQRVLVFSSPGDLRLLIYVFRHEDDGYDPDAVPPVRSISVANSRSRSRSNSVSSVTSTGAIPQPSGTLNEDALFSGTKSSFSITLPVKDDYIPVGAVPLHKRMEKLSNSVYGCFNRPIADLKKHSISTILPPERIEKGDCVDEKGEPSKVSVHEEKVRTTIMIRDIVEEIFQRIWPTIEKDRLSAEDQKKSDMIVEIFGKKEDVEPIKFHSPVNVTKPAKNRPISPNLGVVEPTHWPSAQVTDALSMLKKKSVQAQAAVSKATSSAPSAQTTPKPLSSAVTPSTNSSTRKSDVLERAIKKLDPERGNKVSVSPTISPSASVDKGDASLMARLRKVVEVSSPPIQDHRRPSDHVNLGLNSPQVPPLEEYVETLMKQESIRKNSSGNILEPNRQSNQDDEILSFPGSKRSSFNNNNNKDQEMYISKEERPKEELKVFKSVSPEIPTQEVVKDETPSRGSTGETPSTHPSRSNTATIDDRVKTSGEGGVSMLSKVRQRMKAGGQKLPNSIIDEATAQAFDQDMHVEVAPIQHLNAARNLQDLEKKSSSVVGDASESLSLIEASLSLALQQLNQSLEMGN